MFNLIKQVFIVLLSFSSSLAQDQTKCLFLNDELCMVRPTVIVLNPVELKYHPFMVSLDKYSRCYNVLSPKICVSNRNPNSKYLKSIADTSMTYCDEIIIDMDIVSTNYNWYG